MTGAFGYWRDDGRAGGLPGQGRRARDRRHRQGVRGHLELVGVQRRRPRARVRGRRRAHRHGVRPVPPDRHGLAAGRPRPARHRGGPRRGRDPAQQATASGSCGSTCPRTAATSTRPPTRRPRSWVDARCRRASETDARRPPELSTRDNVARAIYTEVREGRGSPHGGVFLDISYLPAEHVRRKLPSMYDQFKELADVDITTGPMEVGPTTHYVMGGIRVDAETGRDDGARPVRGGRGAPAACTARTGWAATRCPTCSCSAQRTGAGAAAYAAARRATPYVDPVAGPDGRAASWRRRSSARTARTRTRSSATSRRPCSGWSASSGSRSDLDEALDRLADAPRRGWTRVRVRGGARLQPGLEPRVRAAQPARPSPRRSPAAPASGPRAAARTAGSTTRTPTTAWGRSQQRRSPRARTARCASTTAPLPEMPGRRCATSSRRRTDDGSTDARRITCGSSAASPASRRGYDEFDVPVEEGMVVLDALHWIQGHAAPDLAVRWNCKAAKCGSCSAEVNGRPQPDLQDPAVRLRPRSSRSRSSRCGPSRSSATS